MKITFAVLAFNHSKYILDHLNSLKFLIKKFKYNSIELIISDDASSDNTVEIVDKWLAINKNCFNKVVKLYNEKNIGTVQSCINIINNTNTKFIKITAGDDLYCVTDIAEIITQYSDYEIISGLPVYLRGQTISRDKFSDFIHISSSIVYEPNKRAYCLSATNAPNLIYKTNFLKKIIDSKHVNNVTYVEDFLFYALASKFNFKFMQLDFPLVIYRRTDQSAYLIKSNQINNDMNYIFTILRNEANLFYKLLIVSKQMLYNIRPFFLKYFLNIAFYYYFYLVIRNFFLILRSFNAILINIDELNDNFKDLI
jgi:glycosyltransferase involved in cell wall biosynthesis